MSQAVGTDPYRGGKAAVYGPWLSGSHNEAVSTMWYTFAKTSSMQRPGPSTTWVIMDEDKYSINDGGLATVGPKDPPLYQWVDWPSTAHAMAAGIAFGDNHSEIHKWKDARTHINNDAMIDSQPNNQDIWWLSVKTTALINGPTFGVR